MIIIPRFRTLRSAGAGGGGSGPTTDIVGHWDLNEASGTRFDSSKNGRDLVPFAGLSITSAPGVGAGQVAADLSTASKFLQHNTVDNTFQVEDSYFMVNFWWKFIGGGNPVNCPLVGSPATSYATDPNTGWLFNGPYLNTDAQPLYVTMRNVGDASHTSSGATSTLVDRNVWYMLSFIHDPVADQIRVYINTSLVASAAVAGGGHVSTNKQLALNGFPGGYSAYSHYQALTIWKGPGALAAEAELAWLYNGGTAARLAADFGL